MWISAMKLALAITVRRISAVGHIPLLVRPEILPIRRASMGIQHVTRRSHLKKACMLLLRALFRRGASCELLVSRLSMVLTCLESLLAISSKEQSGPLQVSSTARSGEMRWSLTSTDTEVGEDINNAYSLMQGLKSTVYGAVGNHESCPVNSFPPPAVDTTITSQWVYDNISVDLQQWIGATAAAEVKNNYGSYSDVSLCYNWTQSNQQPQLSLFLANCPEPF